MATIGHGSKLVIVGPVGGSNVNLNLDCTSISRGSNKIDTPENTSMLTAGNVKTYQGAMEAPGDVTAKFNSNPLDAAQAALIAAKGLLYNFQIVWPGSIWFLSFEGIVQGDDEEFPDDKLITGTAKIQISGPVVRSATVPTVPNAPTIGTATPAHQAASVQFTPPINNGGAAITGYTVTSSPGSITGTGASSPITVSGLTTGTPYTFTVTAQNAQGSSVASAASNSVTPS
ncbi:MAG TPA: fibronectin type III domain-containing protein [Terracidiphilus sp.]|nr:fibronectin type III domain-containing protein [Terracidiphilus sp.]